MKRFFLIISFFFPAILWAQDKTEELESALEGLRASYEETKTTVDKLSKIKISGYIQAQYQHADSNGAATVAGGDFPSQSMNRLMIRRGRLKVAYTGNYTGYVLQLDATEKGFELKDAYITLTEPLFKTVTLQGGIFYRPFGYEIERSSSLRETPERSRLFQTLFPGERDMGVALEVKSEEGIFSYINAKGGWFNGTRNNVPENDNNKDFIGKINFKLPIDRENGMELDFGFSTYQGKVVRDYQSLPSVSSTSIGLVNNTAVIVPSVSTPVRCYTYEVQGGTYVKTDSSWYPSVKRQYYGGDFQLYIPYAGGTKILGEYITGIQPGTKNSSSYYSPGSGNLYLRKFQGYYLTLVQNIGTRFQLVGRYDVYDPNTAVSGNEVKTTGDIRFVTLGGGLIFWYDANLNFTAYFDRVMNEKTNGCGPMYVNDLKDNVFTLRMQYKF